MNMRVVLCAVAVTVGGCGGGSDAPKVPPLPDQRAALDRFAATANDVCARHARREKRLVVEVTDYAPRSAKRIELETVLANPRFQRDFRLNEARRERLRRETLRRLSAIAAPSGARPAFRGWLSEYRRDKRDHATRADVYATLLGLSRCLKTPGYEIAAAQRVSYAQLIQEFATPPRTERGQVERVVDGRTLELTTGDRVRLAQLARPGGDCEEPARRAIESTLGRSARIDIEVVRPPPPDSRERIAYVFKDRRNVNLALAASGHGLIAPRGLVGRGVSEPAFRPYRPYVVAAAQLAKAARRGLWRTCATDAYRATR